jgi:hypothetical protein
LAQVLARTVLLNFLTLQWLAIKDLKAALPTRNKTATLTQSVNLSPFFVKMNLRATLVIAQEGIPSGRHFL